jgi:hypothetical protein
MVGVATKAGSVDASIGNYVVHAQSPEPKGTDTDTELCGGTEKAIVPPRSTMLMRCGSGCMSSATGTHALTTMTVGRMANSFHHPSLGWKA